MFALTLSTLANITFFWGLLSIAFCALRLLNADVDYQHLNETNPISGKILVEPFLSEPVYLQWLPLFLFVRALKACPVHTTIHSVEFWRERAASKQKSSKLVRIYSVCLTVIMPHVDFD